MKKRCIVVRLVGSSNSVRATRKLFAIKSGFKPIVSLEKDNNKIINYVTNS